MKWKESDIGIWTMIWNENGNKIVKEENEYKWYYNIDEMIMKTTCIRSRLPSHPYTI